MQWNIWNLYNFFLLTGPQVCIGSALRELDLKLIIIAPKCVIQLESCINELPNF